MRTVSHWCFNHKLVVLGGWIAILAAALLLQSTTGSNFSSGNVPSGSDSATARTLLQKAAPSVSGDSEQIVFAVKAGRVTAPAVRASVKADLAKVATLPNVSGVTSPFSRQGASQISHNGKVAFATVNFTKDAKDISSSEASRFVKTARGPNSNALQVEVLGEVASSTISASSSSTLLGVGAALIVLLFVFGSFLTALVPLLSTGIALAAAISVVGSLSNTISMAPKLS